MDEMLTPKEAAKILKCTDKHIRNLIKLGLIRASITNYSVHKPRYLIALTALKDFLKNAEIKPMRCV